MACLWYDTCVAACCLVGACDPRAFDVHEVALMFLSSAHQGDKRKTSQQFVSTSLFRQTNELQDIMCLRVAVTCGSHKSIEFNKCKAMLGRIKSVKRSRDHELTNPEEGGGCLVVGFNKFFHKLNKVFHKVCEFFAFADPYQVQQRGVAATQDIISKLLEGVPLNDGHPILIVDCMPNRFLIKKL